MAEETHGTAAAEVVITTATTPAAEVIDKEVALPPAPEQEVELKTEEEPKEEAAGEKEKDKEEGEAVKEKKLPQSTSFKEESNKVADLVDPEKKALDELKLLIKAAVANNEFTKPPPPPLPKEEEKPAKVEAEKPKEEEPATVEQEVKKQEGTAKVEATREVEDAVKEDVPCAVDGSTKPEASMESEQLTPPPTEREEPTEAAKPEEEKKDTIVVDEDGAKTMEAIEETVVPVAAPAAAEPQQTEKDVAVETPPSTAATEAAAEAEPEEIILWGVRLLDGSEKSDTILLKFLRARDFKPKDALAMLRKTVLWRKDFGTDGLLEEDLGVPGLEKVVFMHGVDREGHPVCYNAYGEFQDRELYQKAFGDEEKRKRFLRWRVQFLEKGIKEKLEFGPEGVNTMVQVTDLKNSPGPGRMELGKAVRQGVALLQDNYPEFVAKQVFINVPWWYLAFHRMISPFLTQRTKSKFVYAGPSRSADTLFKYIAPEQVPVQYGGLSGENITDFAISDAVTEVAIKPSSKHTIEIPATEPCLVVWELRVLGWGVSYGAEFVPDAEGGYTVVVQKSRKFIAVGEPIVKNSFKIGEPGKIVLTIDNATSRKKKLLYRSKTELH